MTRKQKILKLRSKKKTIAEIAKLAGCCKRTVYYNLSSRKRSRSIRSYKWKRRNALAVKLHNYKYQNTRKRKKYGVIEGRDKFTIEQLLKKFGPKPRCYLTGRSIDLDSLNLGPVLGGQFFRSLLKFGMGKSGVAFKELGCPLVIIGSAALIGSRIISSFSREAGEEGYNIVSIVTAVR
jgi:hypothetical protein